VQAINASQFNSVSLIPERASDCEVEVENILARLQRNSPVTRLGANLEKQCQSFSAPSRFALSLSRSRWQRRLPRVSVKQAAVERLLGLLLVREVHMETAAHLILSAVQVEPIVVMVASPAMEHAAVRLLHLPQRPKYPPMDNVALEVVAPV
jgi:hypothetical protein